MPDIREHEEGMLCWADLSTTDLEGAKRFYGELFGWSLSEAPPDPEGPGPYVFARLRGKDVGAMSGMPDALKGQGIPPHWNGYIAVKDVDARAAKAEKAGGKLLMSPFDAMDAGRMAIVEDPTGAVISLWQAKKHQGAGVMNEPGALCWAELLTHDAKAAAKFYSAVLPWKAKTSPTIEGGEYTEWMVGDKASCGMMELRGPEHEHMPSNWGVYFAVADCDASVKRAQHLGAAAVVPPTNIPKVGRFAVLRDPQGAHFNVLKYDPNQA